MARMRWGGIGCLLGLVSGCTSTAPDPLLPPRVLARAPLCEASAAEVAPWDDTVVLVGDNEIDDALYAVAREPAGWLTGLERMPLPADVAVDDIEALAVADGRIVIVGSHGRSARCERRPAREHLAVVERDPADGGLSLVSWTDSTVAMDRALESVDGCLEALFVTPVPVGASEFCERVNELQRGLSRDRCIPPLDVEAALAVPGPAGARVWIGLRQPRVDGRPTLLRLAQGLHALSFDAVAWLQEGDRGIRGATRSDDDLWLILGPGPPDFDHSTLWRAAVEDLVPGAMVPGELVVDGLLPESEGVVVVDGVATIVIDGDEASVAGSICSDPALQQVIRLPGR